MVTPDFEDWLARQEIDDIYLTEKETYTQHMIDEYGFTGGSVNIVERHYTERYEVFEPYGIRAVKWHFTSAGETYYQTRYVITEPYERGLWGAVSAFKEAEKRASAVDDWERAGIARRRWEMLEKYPEKYKRWYKE